MATQIEADRDLTRKRIRLQCGLDEAAVLPKHIEVIAEISDCIPNIITRARPLFSIPRDRVGDVKKLLRKLPRTTEIESLLQAL